METTNVTGMTAQEIKETLSQGTFKFKYTKKDGTERVALGTRNPGLLSEYNATPSGNGTEKVGVIAYYDIDKHGWRCFTENSFAGFIPSI